MSSVAIHRSCREGGNVSLEDATLVYWFLVLAVIGWALIAATR
jgi:hypothetical protein